MKNKQNLFVVIVNEAMNAFLEKGYKNLNVDELVAQIGISKATFYKYIPSKEILFEECVRTYLEKFRKELRQLINKILKSNQETFFALFMEIIKLSTNFLTTITNLINVKIEKRFPQISLKLREFTKKQIETSFFSIINKGRELRLIKNEISDEVLYFIIYTTLINLKQFTQREGKEITLNTFLNHYFQIIFNGILEDEIKVSFYYQ
ncbi:TetR/AcrR family transcriptional regulator [Bacteroidetes/Chlorobi group bacterium MS-B_bin-24]|nr:MAG: TetR/AcrR family transcriptional regulator [Bacteroidetes/Chlorobi group bacterium MS-B_bin-24]